MTIDIKYVYLNTPMERFEYTQLKLSNLPADFIKQYSLTYKVTKEGYVYIKVCKGMYGLPQAGILAHQLLKKRLSKQGYHHSSITPGFWVHKWLPISFTLCVDNFGAKYVGEEHNMHT